MQPCDNFYPVMYEQKKYIPLPGQIIYFWWSISASLHGAVFMKCLSEWSCQSTWLYKLQQWAEASVNPHEACTINNKNISFDTIESTAPTSEIQTDIPETKAEVGDSNNMWGYSLGNRIYFLLINSIFAS